MRLDRIAPSVSPVPVAASLGSAFDPLRILNASGTLQPMFEAVPRLRATARFLSGLLVGIAGSATVAGWLFAAFQWLGVRMNATTGSFRLVDWAAMLATWIAAEFAGQTIAANVARSVAVIWLVAATHAAVLLFTYYFVPHPALLVGAPLGFVIAWRMKDGDLVRMAKVVLPER